MTATECETDFQAPQASAFARTIVNFKFCIKYRNFKKKRGTWNS